MPALFGEPYTILKISHMRSDANHVKRDDLILSCGTIQSAELP